MPDEGLAATYQATVPVDHSQFAVFDYLGDAVLTDLRPAQSEWLVAAGYGGAVFHAWDKALEASVTLELWRSEPPADMPTEAEAQAPDQRFFSPSGTVTICAVIASASDRNAELLGPGHYVLRARRTRTRDITEDGDELRGEDWLLQVWPDRSDA
ncbi:hypothetical protein [Amycolatopsis sp. NPDC059021]|uniref:hypothetical protein n=1 Tax=Amycolatopsis sp. NPDC059021 TaxID=3346704 RepID=UPI00366E23AD